MKRVIKALIKRSVEFAGSALVGLGIIGFVFSAVLVFDACSWPWDPETTGVHIMNDNLFTFAVRGLYVCTGIIAFGLILIFPKIIAIFAFPFRFIRRGEVVVQDGCQTEEESIVDDEAGSNGQI